MSDESSDKMGFNATWSMAVGGMVGGGIFSVLGVVIEVAGTWAWVSFVLAGLIALCEKTVPLAMLTAILSVIGVYLLVTFGTIMLVGPATIIEYKEVALAKAGQAVGGTWGLWVVTIAAFFSTVSAINATLFAVGRLAERVAQDGELPRFFEHENNRGYRTEPSSSSAASRPRLRLSATSKSSSRRPAWAS